MLRFFGASRHRSEIRLPRLEPSRTVTSRSCISWPRLYKTRLESGDSNGANSIGLTGTRRLKQRSEPCCRWQMTLSRTGARWCNEVAVGATPQQRLKQPIPGQVLHADVDARSSKVQIT